LFEDGQYKLDFSQITGITAATSFIKASKYLYLKGAVIEYQSTVNSMSLFEGSAATANITFEVKWEVTCYNWYF